LKGCNELHDAGNPRIINGDRGLLYAEACFETFRVIGGAIFDWNAHETRLQSGLAAFGLDLPKGLKRQCVDAAHKAGPDALVRLTVTGGDAPRSLLPASARHAGIYIHARAYAPRTDAIHLRTALWPMPLYARPAKFTADYAHTIRGLRQLEKNGLLACAEEALICDETNIYSAATANVMLLQGGEWLTPAADAVLPGVVRAALIQAGCARLCPCPRGLAHTCDAIALTNSGWFVRPVASINGRKLQASGTAFARLYAPLLGQPGAPARFL